ncbi:phosphodiesterase [Luethyella okanaganae]|uniref:Phosphodiesterase n=1 Tax=Luethyella okanaganae TaxID=69372 RepID=A0ABW1VET7_9MICO
MNDEQRADRGRQAGPAQMGQHPAACLVIAHISDTHFLGGGRELYGRVDTDIGVWAAMRQLERSGIRPDAFVFTGDIADRGEPDAYLRVRDIVEPVAERLGAELVWVMGNHDARAAFRSELLRETGRQDVGAPVDRIVEVGGLRIVALDTSVPGYHHGAIERSQLEWLAAVLATPAPLGTVLALHHPPIPTPLAAMTVLELEHQHELAAVVAGSDVRAILGGHLHYATTSLFAGVPVSVAAATCYTMDLSAPSRELVGVDGGQSINLVHVYEDRIVHSVVPLGEAPVATRFDADFLARLEAMTPELRRESFSRQVSSGDPGA